MPTGLKVALIDGKQPWDGVDAVFVSHYHEGNKEPAQAVDGLLKLAESSDAVFDRVHSLALSVGDVQVRIVADGLLRQLFPKSPDLSNIHQNRLNAVARQLNERPRKSLNIRTPAQRFSECVVLTG